MTVTYFNGCLTFAGETFTGDLTTVISDKIAATSTTKIEVTGWSLRVHGNSGAATCTIQDSTATPRIFASMTFPIVEAGSRGDIWNVKRRAMTATGKNLVVAGGGTAGLLSGVIFCRLVPISSI